MIRNVSVTCDGCGVEKHETNGWWLLVVESGDLVLYPWKLDDDAPSDAKHVCGHQCAHRLLDRFLQAGQLEPITTPRSEPVRAGATA